MSWGRIGIGPEEICDECDRRGRVGTDIGPYNFPGEITRALCVPFTGRPCVAKRYQKMREYFAKESASEQAGHAARKEVQG